MSRRLAAFAAAFALVLALGVSPAAASGPITHMSWPATEEGTIACGADTYAFTAGTFSFVFRDSSVGAHITAVNVWAVDQDGASYRVVGTETYSDPTMLVTELRFVSSGGGVADTASIVAHFSPNGTWHYFDFGTCAFG